jgi:hypothetical protein
MSAPKPAHRHFVYVMGREDLTETKIGRTTNVAYRRSQCQTFHAKPIKVFGTFAFAKEEDAIHVEEWSQYPLLKQRDTGEEVFLIDADEALRHVNAVLSKHYRFCDEQDVWVNVRGHYAKPPLTRASTILARKRRREMLARPDVKAKHIAATTEAMNRPDVKERVANTLRIRSHNPEVKAQLTAAAAKAGVVNSQRMRERWQDPEFRAKATERNRANAQQLRLNALKARGGQEDQLSTASNP